MALYQKYRPVTFGEVIGQEHVTKTLQNLIKSESVPQAYLFFGPQGTGKTSVARILARAVNCSGDVKPCNQCPSCIDFLNRSLDLIEMDAATNSGVANVRETIRDAAHFQPNMARYKVYIIDEVHGLSRQAFDSLLKILEEPPRHLIFILATTEFDKVPKTVISRCQLHSFHRIGTEEIFSLLVRVSKEEGIPYEDRGLQAIARFANGCARDALSLLDQVSVYKVTSERVSTILGLGEDGDSVRLIESLEKGQSALVDCIDKILSRGVVPAVFIDQTLSVLQQMTRCRLGLPEWVSDVVYDLCQVSSMTTKDLLGVISAFLSAKDDLKLVDPFTALSIHLLPLASEEVTPQVTTPKKVDPLKDSIAQELISMGFELVFANPK